MEATSKAATQASTARAFEIEAGTLDEFFELLRAREEEAAAEEDETTSLARRALYVCASQHRTYTGYGLPERVRRFVAATFCYGEDLVRYQKDTSYRLETWTSPDSLNQDDHQRKALRRMKTEIECVLEDLGLPEDRVPVLVGAARRCSWEARSKP